MAEGNRLERRDLTLLKTDLFITPELSGPPGSNATILHLFGLAHHKLSYRFQYLDFRLTDVNPAKDVKGLVV
jgi:hypothetical protein